MLYLILSFYNSIFNYYCVYQTVYKIPESVLDGPHEFVAAGSSTTACLLFQTL